MIDSENCKLAYLAARMGLGLHLIYMGGMTLYGFIAVKNSGLGAKIPWAGDSNIMPLFYFIPIIVLIVGLFIIMDKHVRPIAIVVAALSIAGGLVLPAVVALGLIIFYQHDITILEQRVQRAD